MADYMIKFRDGDNTAGNMRIRGAITREQAKVLFHKRMPGFAILRCEEVGDAVE